VVKCRVRNGFVVSQNDRFGRFFRRKSNRRSGVMSVVSHPESLQMRYVKIGDKDTGRDPVIRLSISFGVRVVAKLLVTLCFGRRRRTPITSNDDYCRRMRCVDSRIR
jgi:hypothetical protein